MKGNHFREKKSKDISEEEASRDASQLSQEVPGSRCTLLLETAWKDTTISKMCFTTLNRSVFKKLVLGNIRTPEHRSPVQRWGHGHDTLPVCVS